jgi:uncharacterized membrane protein YhhN
MRVSRASRWAPVYWACVGAHVAGTAFGQRALRIAAKSAMMPALAIWARAHHGSPLLVTALLFSSVGDTLMEAGLLLPAITVYAAAHACYVALFVRRPDRRRWRILAAYAVLGVALMAALWPGLGELRAPVAAYSLMLTATAVTSGWSGGRSAAGGALFLTSDSLIGARLAGWNFRHRDLLVGITYTLGQYNLAAGSLPPAVRTV